MCLNFGIQNAPPLLNQSLKGSKIGVVCTPLTDYQLTTIDYYTRACLKNILSCSF